MGYGGVKSAIGVLSGKPVGKRIATGVVAAAKKNLDTSKISTRLRPF
jgi:hypothetical protein